MSTTIGQAPEADSLQRQLQTTYNLITNMAAGGYVFQNATNTANLATGMYNPLRALATVVNGVSPLALAMGGKSIAAQNQQLIASVAAALTPSIYFDPSKTALTSTGAGTSANPAYSAAQLQSLVNGDKPGVVVGLARGTTFSTGGDLVLKTGSSRVDKPLVFIPYGDSTLALPTIDSGVTINTWALDGTTPGAYSTAMSPYAQTVWQKFPDGSEKRLHYIYNNTLALKRTRLAALGAGYCFWDNGTFYCIPYAGANPSNTSIMVKGGGTSANASLTINHVNQSASGNVIVYGIATRHHLSNGILVGSDGTVGSVSTLGKYSVVGCDVQHNGTSQDLANFCIANCAATVVGATGVMTVSTLYATGNTTQYLSPGMILTLPVGAVIQSQLTGTPGAGGGATYQLDYRGADDNSGATRVGRIFTSAAYDGVIIYGISDTIRPSIRVASNFVRDVGNNALEVALISSGYNEFNTVVDCCSNAIIEMYGTCTNVLSRYNFSIWVENQAYPWYANDYPIYMGRIYWQACIDAATLSVPAPTNTIALKTSNNTIEFNVAINCPAASANVSSGLTLADPMKDDGCPYFVVRNNTFFLNVAQSGVTVNGPIFGNAITSGNGAAWTCLAGAAAPTYSGNNLKINSAGINIRLLLWSPNYASISGFPQGDKNNYYSDNTSSTNFTVCNKAYDNITATSPITTLAAWVVASGMDSTSVVLNPMFDGNGIPAPYSPAIRYGAYAGPLAMVDGYALNDTPNIYRTSGIGVLTAATSVVVNHNLPAIPLIQDIALTPQGACLTPPYVSTVTATQFTINIAAATTANIGWSASVNN